MRASTDRPDAASRDAPVVLIVDDDPVVRRLVRHGLADSGCGEMLEATDGVEAREILGERAVDLVITDLLMPRLDGLGLIAWANEHRPGATWIILSGVDTFDAAVEAIRLGAFHFLSKPPRIQELEVAVRNALEHRRLLVERERLVAELAQANARLARQVRELEGKSELIRRDLERAEVIQRALLPAEPPPLERHRISAIYRPGLHVGGDLYRAERVGARHLVLYVADATGHGVSAAMLSVLFHRRLTLRGDDGEPLQPAAALQRVNRALCADGVSPGLFLTAAYALLDLQAGDLRVAGAGHPAALLRRADGELRRLPRTGPALGLTPDAVYEQTTEHFASGDRLLLFTDGLLENRRQAGGAELVERALLQGADDGPGLLAALVGNPGQADDRDDTTAVLLEAAPGRSSFDNGAASTAPRPAAAPTPARSEGPVWYGESEHGCFLALRGRATWTASDAFHATARAILESGRPLVIDLSACEYLDSTFLGTIHELVVEGGERGGEPRVQGAAGPVHDAFEELSMERVVRAGQRPPLPLPDGLGPLAAPAAGSGERGRQRILQAHEALAAIGRENRDRFQGVLDSLRRE